MRDAVARAAFALLTPEQMAEVAVSRAFIERAKGMLMLVYDVDADNAFELLKFGSQNTNVKLRALAKRLTEDLAGLAQRQPQTMRSVCDEVLFSTNNPPRPPPEVG